MPFTVAFRHASGKLCALIICICLALITTLCTSRDAIHYASSLDTRILLGQSMEHKRLAEWCFALG
jgi:hypothetical protein